VKINMNKIKFKGLKLEYSNSLKSLKYEIHGYRFDKNVKTKTKTNYVCGKTLDLNQKNINIHTNITIN
jgi:hypothetical protein